MRAGDDSPGVGAWPADGLEPVAQCPVCGSKSRTLLYERLRDRIFFCAPGEWTLYRCDHCRSGYLDPRPTRETIHLAYGNYFTHSVTDAVRRSLDKPFARVFANGYRNWRYGTKDRPSSWLGVLVKAVQPGRRAQIDADMRHLSKPRSGATLLDVGCGNGQFLKRASDMGWHAVGIDPDPVAVAVAKSLGLDVRVGGIELLQGRAEVFDLITLSHVVEHVHDPLGLLRACYRLLRPKGRVWVDTPNLGSLGHTVYGSNWRDLDPPRHLVVFNCESLRGALGTAGFGKIIKMPYRPVCAAVFAASEAIAAGRDREAARRTSLALWGTVWAAERNEATEPSVREFVTVCAEKPVARCV